MMLLENIRKGITRVNKFKQAFKKAKQVFFGRYSNISYPESKPTTHESLFCVAKKNSNELFDKFFYLSELNQHKRDIALMADSDYSQASYSDPNDNKSLENMMEILDCEQNASLSKRTLEKPRILLMASNYLLFKNRSKTDEKVDKDSFEYKMVEIAAPENYDLACLITGCELSARFTMNKIPNSLYILISDLPNASNPDYVKKVRDNVKTYGLPQAYKQIIEYYFGDIKLITRQDINLGISQQERTKIGNKNSYSYNLWMDKITQNLDDFKNGRAILWGLESEYRKRATKLVKNIEKKGLLSHKPFWNLSASNNKLYLVNESSTTSLSKIPIAVLTGKSKQPQCSLYTTEIFREICSFGFNAFVGLYDYHESQTVNKATQVAKRYYDIDIDSIIVGIDERKYEIISTSINGQSNLPFTRFQK
jgi:hypothetical protein